MRPYVGFRVCILGVEFILSHSGFLFGGLGLLFEIQGLFWGLGVRLSLWAFSSVRQFQLDDFAWYHPKRFWDFRV